MRRFGGLDEFVAAWKCAIDEAAMNGRSYLVVRGFEAIFRLIEAHTQLHESHADLLDDRDLANQLDQVMTRVIAGNPELAISVCRRLGWQVTPAKDESEEVRRS